MMRFQRLFATSAFLLTGIASVLAARPALADGLASPWVEGYNNKARLIAGKAVGGPYGSATMTYAGIEIAMPAGWKTYWRSPGDSGVPPEFDWSASENLGSATVYYPAPHRLVDKGGVNIGYKDHVVLPIVVHAKDPTIPVTLKIKAAYGVCKEICVPAEAELQLTVPPDSADSPELAEALKTVPIRAVDIVAQPGKDPMAVLDPAKDPMLAKWRVDDRSGKPVLVLEVTNPGGTDGDAFADAAGGIYIPLPKKIADEGGRALYEVDLTDGVDIKDLKGKPLAITLTGSKGQSETSITLP